MHRNILRTVGAVAMAAAAVSLAAFIPQAHWQSKLVHTGKGGALIYTPDSRGAVLPDFSRVGYFQGNRPVPRVPVSVTLRPARSGDDGARIQHAIDELSKKKADSAGFRGAILLKKGVYHIAGTLHIDSGGIVLRGEGNSETGTVVVATGTVQRTLLDIGGQGNPEEIPGTRSEVTDAYVPVGTHRLRVAQSGLYKPGDEVILLRPGTAEWIHDLHMDQIIPRTKGKNKTQQWKPGQYNLSFQRTVVAVLGDTVVLDNPVVMELSARYGGAFLYKYRFGGRIENMGVEDIYFRSDYAGDTDESHGWTAVQMNRLRNGWVRRVTARYFGYSCVLLGSQASQVTVENAACLDGKSRISGGRRYSFCNNGQLNLFRDLYARDGRHDFVTGARTLGPNVFYNCRAEKANSDTGPHHRWAVGTLYDNITTDGPINVQDRGNSGTGHGWAGVTQVLWNCRAREAAVQSPWVSGKNYCIGLTGARKPGHFPDRPQGQWEGANKPGLKPASLYIAQRNAR